MEGQQSDPSRTTRYFHFTAFALLALAVVAHCSMDYAGSDREWLLYATREWLQGKKLYADLFETNPPLIIWLYALPVYAALHLGIPVTFNLLAGLGTCVVIGSIAVSVRLLTHHSTLQITKNEKPYLLLLLGYSLIFFVRPAFYCDRDHLFLVLAFPYIIRWMPSVARSDVSRALKFAVGGMAGIGFCIKPHCAIVFCGIQLFYLIRWRSLGILWSLENGLVYLTAAVYILCVRLFAPDYIFVVLPMLLATFYACNAKFYWMIYAYKPALNLCVPALAFKSNATPVFRPDIVYFIGIIALFCLYILANNGWEYTYQPLNSLVLFTVGMMLWAGNRLRISSTDPLKIKRYNRAFEIASIILVFNIIVSAQYFVKVLVSYCDGVCENNEQMVKVLKRENAHSFGTLSLNFTNWPYLSRMTGAEWGTRFHFLWMMSKFLNENEKEKRNDAWILHYVADKLADDLNTNKPQLVFEEHDNDCFIRHENNKVDFAEFYSAYPKFKQAWSHYTFLQSLDHVYLPKDTDKAAVLSADTVTIEIKDKCVYYIYRRNDDAKN